MLFNTNLGFSLSHSITAYSPLIEYKWNTFTESNQRYLKDSGSSPKYHAQLFSGQGKYFNGIDSRIEDVNCVVGDIGVAIVTFKSTDTGYIFSQQGTNRLYIKSDGRIGLGDSANIITGATPNDGQFHTIVLAWDNGNWTYTVDGLDTYSGTYLGTVDITIGSLSGSKWYGDYNESLVKDVYIFNRLLTEIEFSKQPEQFFNDALLDSTCVFNMPMNDKGNTCRDYVTNTDYPISNFLTTTNTNAQNLSYGLQDAKLITDNLGVISGVSQYFEGNGIGYADTGWTPPNTPFTILAIVKPNGTSQIEGQYTDSNKQTSIETTLSGYVRTKVGTVSITSSVTYLNQNVFVAFGFDGVNLFMSVNGESIQYVPTTYVGANGTYCINRLREYSVVTNANAYKTPTRLRKVVDYAQTQEEVTKAYNNAVAKGLLT